MNWKDKRVLVTGGAGFIGSHLVDELIRRSAQVKVVDDLSRGKLSNIEHCIDKIDFVKGDLANKKVAEETIRGVEVCFHLAAVVGGVEYMVSHPSEIFKTACVNYNVLEACRKTNVDRLLYTSTACVYPVNLQESADQPPLKEEEALTYEAKPDGNYGWVKLLGEIQCRAYYETYGMKIAVIRPFNPYGPRESFDPTHSHVIPALIRRAVNREKPFVVWGDGKQTRSFEYIEDVVEGIMLAIEKAVDVNPINLGGSNDVTIKELAELILKLTNYDTSISWDTTRPQGVKTRKADVSRAQKILGWAPKTSLEEGLTKTVNWYMQRVLNAPLVGKRRL